MLSPLAVSSPQCCESVCCSGSPGMVPWPRTPSSHCGSLSDPEHQEWVLCSTLHRTSVVLAWVSALSSGSFESPLRAIWLLHLPFTAGVPREQHRDHFFQDTTPLCVHLSFPLLLAVDLHGLPHLLLLGLCLAKKASIYLMATSCC